MEKLFVNDPFVRVYEVFRQFYPDNPNPRFLPEVFVSADLPVKHTVEILAHGLAHVAVGAQSGNGCKKPTRVCGGGDAELVVCLLPARTDTAWWHDYCMRGEVRFLRGRLKFGNSKNSAPFPSALVIFKRE